MNTFFLGRSVLFLALWEWPLSLTLKKKALFGNILTHIFNLSLINGRWESFSPLPHCWVCLSSLLESRLPMCPSLRLLDSSSNLSLLKHKWVLTPTFMLLHVSCSWSAMWCVPCIRNVTVTIAYLPHAQDKIPHFSVTVAARSRQSRLRASMPKNKEGRKTGVFLAHL